MADPDPAGGAGPRRGVRVAAAALLMLALIAGGGIAFWYSSPSAAVPTGYRAYLDRSQLPVIVVEENGQIWPLTQTVAESGLLGTIAAIPNDLATLLLAALGDTADDPSLRIERVMSSQVNPDGSVFATTYLNLLTADGYQLALGSGTGGVVLLYTPPRTELPAELTPGATWSSPGMLNFERPFTYEGSVAAAEPRDGRECREVTTALDQQGADGSSEKRTSVFLWCEGMGSVEARTLENGMRYLVAEPGSVQLTTPIPPAPEPLPAGTVLDAPFTNTGVSLSPLVIGGLVITTNRSISDIDAMRLVPATAEDPATGAAASPAAQILTWVQHPGGEVTGMTTGGDPAFIYLTTTRRMLMAFDAAGQIRWYTRLPDASVGQPALAGDVVAVALLNGTVQAFDHRTGERRWTSRLADTVAAEPVTSGDLVIAADTSGLIQATGSDGTPRWSGSTAAIRRPMTPLGDGGVIAQDAKGIVHALSPEGDERWSVSLDANVSEAGIVLGSTVVLPTDSGVVGLSIDDGTERWRHPGLRRPHLLPDGTVSAQEVVARIEPDGRLTPLATLSAPNAVSLERTWPMRVGGQLMVINQAGAITVVDDA